MMANVIVYSRADGGVSVCHPLQANEAGIAWVIDNDIPTSATRLVVVDETSVPSDRIFRDAWAWDGKRFDTDMPKAREIHMKGIRAARDESLRNLDTQVLKALATGDTTAVTTIESQRQSLRDLPGRIDLSQYKTPQDLALAWPSELDARR